MMTTRNFSVVTDDQMPRFAQLKTTTRRASEVIHRDATMMHAWSIGTTSAALTHGQSEGEEMLRVAGECPPEVYIG